MTDVLKAQIIESLSNCEDESLLDFILKLLIFEDGDQLLDAGIAVS